MNNGIFTDGAVAIRLANGMVRVEFGILPTLGGKGEGDEKVEQVANLVMTPKAFLQTFSKMERMLHALAESKVIVKSRETEEEKRQGPARDQSVILETDG